MTGKKEKTNHLKSLMDRKIAFSTGTGHYKITLYTISWQSQINETTHVHCQNNDLFSTKKIFKIH